MTGLPGDKRRGKILTQKHLAGYRRAHDAQRSFAGQQAAKSGATVPGVAAAIRKAYGDVFDKLQAKGLVTLTQSQDEALEAAAKARADKTGKPLAEVREKLLASMQGESTLDVKRSADGAIQGFYDPESGQSFLIADGLTEDAAATACRPCVGCTATTWATWKE